MTESTSKKPGDLTWRLLGNFDRTGRVSLVTSSIAIIMASITFDTPKGAYSPLLTVFAFAAAAFAIFRAYKTKAIIGVLYLPIAALWINPVLGGTWFSSLTPQFYFAHALFAMLQAVAAFSFLRGAPKRG